LLGLDHVSLAVADLDRSIAFYHGLLDIPILGRGEERGGGAVALVGGSAHFRYADLDLGSGQILELLQFVLPKNETRSGRSGIEKGHFGLRMDDLAGTLRRLRKSGFEPRTEPVHLEAPSWWQGATCVYVTDPDGATVELVERRR
jgi:catechol 2,3-dioxygenase-like lactoylglutathione lyase family enzyme